MTGELPNSEEITIKYFTIISGESVSIFQKFLKEAKKLKKVSILGIKSQIYNDIMRKLTPEWNIKVYDSSLMRGKHVIITRG